MDKEEVVNLSKSLGLYEISTMEYKDCCSIIIRHPIPRPRLEAVNMEWERLALDRAVQETLKEIVVYDGTNIAPWKNLSRPPSLSNQE
jgi:thiamine biosynthesis protein ThiI